jgi:4-amino-4-deoxy-L-arabinose transferase-like glycosyltransferase
MKSGNIGTLINKYFPLLSILIGITIVLVSTVPFTNGDTQWEYEAALGVIKWGKPYVITFGNMINQPPLGFYVEALFFKIFGLSLETGVSLVTIFGLGCIILVYKIGKLLYSNLTGLLAAVLFALTPWQVVLSRSFLIDTQCLFFSLFSLFVGILAFRKNSIKLFIVSGTLFSAAFLTKFYAVFSLLPILLFYIYYRPKNLKRIIKWFGAFFIPVLLFVFLWYEVFSGQGLLSLFQHKDFVNLNPNDVVPSYFFVGNFLLNYGLGWFFISATIFSMTVGLSYRKLFSRIRVFDLICLATIVSIVSVNTFLGAGLNLKAPYYNVVKYDYQSLPFFSLLAASLLIKCFSFFNSIKSTRKMRKFINISIVFIGVALLAGSILTNIFYVHLISLWPSILFRFDINKDAGYFLFHNNPIDRYNPLLILQYFGFMFMLFGLLWASRDKIEILISLVIAKIKPRYRINPELLLAKTRKVESSVHTEKIK